MTVALACPACGATVPDTAWFPWRCPNAVGGDRHHVLHRVPEGPDRVPVKGDRQPFVANDHRLVWARLAQAQGMGAGARGDLVHEVDDAVRAVAGTGFEVRPAVRHQALSDLFGFRDGAGIWLQNLTVEPAGSQKARHLLSILLHLLCAERLGVADPDSRAPLAIASCGNAALAAATLAASLQWPIEVFVPEWADPAVTDRLDDLGATVHRCPRLDSDPPGDPCVHRFREAVARGSVPFGVQGPENALCLDGGRTFAWDALSHAPDGGFDMVFAQVGGGAFATSMGFGLADAGAGAALMAVQTQGCAPLARAWGRALEMGIDQAAGRWSECMWPWEHEPRSAATGILDDETYDWVGIVHSMATTGGEPLVVGEDLVAQANELVNEVAGINADHTGTAALAGVLAIRDRLDLTARLLVPITGVRRSREGSR